VPFNNPHNNVVEDKPKGDVEKDATFGVIHNVHDIDFDENL